MCCSVRRRLGLVAAIVALGWLVGCRIDALLHPSAATGAPDARLTFAPPPNGTVDQPLSPPVRVTAVDSAGRVDTTFQLPVTLTLDANPGRATLAGTRTVAAVRGVATFSDLSLNQPGTGYTLLATAPGVQGVTSPPFDVTAPPPPTGSLTVSTSTSGSSPDPDGYTFSVDGGASQAIGIDATITLTGGRTGRHTVVLSDIASNCSVSGGAPPPPTGSLAVTTSSSGGTLDPDGYTFTVDGGASQAIGTDATVTLTGVSTGSHTVVLSDIASNCSVSGGTSRTVNVPAGGTGTASFSVSCPTPPPPTGSLAVTTSSSGGTLDPDGYTFTVDGGASQAIGINETITLTGVNTRRHTVVLSGIASNCTVSGRTSPAMPGT